MLMNKNYTLSKSKLRKALFVFFASILLVGVPQMAVASPGMQCQESYESVNLSPTNPTPYQMFVEICWNGSQQGKTAQILLHGTTYDHNYWG